MRCLSRSHYSKGVAQFNTLFLGVSKAERRGIVKSWLERREYKTFEDPSVGTYAVAIAAIRAGYKPGQLITGDLSLLSSILGYYLDPYHSLDELHLTPTEEMDYFTKTARDEEEYVAGLLLCAKYFDTPTSNLYNVRLKGNIWKERDAHLLSLTGQIRALSSACKGLTYEVQDVRQVVSRLMEQDDRACWLSLPTVKGGYTKQFQESELRMWHGGFLATADWRPTDTFDYLLNLTEAKTDILAIVYDEDHIPDGWDRIAAFDRGPKAPTEYIISNRPWERRYTRAPRSAKQRFYYELFDEHEITPESVLSFRLVPSAVGEYYRDLLVHKMGPSGAYDYILALIDGQIIGIVGSMTSDLYRGWETFPVNFATCLTSKRYPKLGRLIRLALTTTDFRLELKTQIRALETYTWTRVGQTTFCAGPTPSQDRGIFKVVERTKLKGGGYKVRLYSDVREMTYKEAIERWLQSGKGA